MGSYNSQESRSHPTKSLPGIDIGKTDIGITYVALSRVQNLSSCVIEPMTFERLSALKSSRNLKFRQEEEERLDYLAETTAAAFNH